MMATNNNNEKSVSLFIETTFLCQTEKVTLL